MDGDLVYRLPPYAMSPQIYSAEDVTEVIDWGLTNNGIPDVHKLSEGEGVRIAVLDTGASEHPDVGELAFMLNTTNSPTPFDRQGHGTHVQGTIRMLRNGVGGIGVAPKATLGSIKVLGDDGAGSNRWIRDGIYKAIDQKVDIISMSLGGPYDPGIEQACMDAIQSGIFIICAAGNDGLVPGQDTIGWPARLGATIAIASYNAEGKISEYSSRGPEVDFAFPGENIFSTWVGGKYRRISGTSMATPFCSGTVALLLSHYRKFASKKVPRNNTELRELLKSFSKDMGKVGKDNDWGFGIPDITGEIKAAGDVSAVSGWTSFGGFSFKYPAVVDGRTCIALALK